MKRMIRGMLPYKKERGLKAFKRVKTYLGVPEEFKDKIEKIDIHNYKNSNITKYVTLGDLSKQLGGRSA
jgi:ribosomal protein uL13